MSQSNFYQVRLALLEVTFYVSFLIASSSEARASRDYFFFLFFLSLDFHELWCSVMSICLFTEVKQQWATLVLGWVTTSVHYSCLMALWLALVD